MEGTLLLLKFKYQGPISPYILQLRQIKWLFWASLRDCSSSPSFMVANIAVPAVIKSGP